MKADDNAALAEAVQRLLDGGVAGRVEVAFAALDPEPVKEDKPRDPALRPPPEAA